MKSRIVFLILIMIACGIPVAAQKMEPVLGVNGEQVQIDKGWKYIAYLADKKDKVTDIYSYQIKSVVNFTPNSFKFWVKQKSYQVGSSISYILFLTEVRCRTRESRTPKIVDYRADGSIAESVSNSGATFEDVAPESVGEEILTTICKEYDK